MYGVTFPSKRLFYFFFEMEIRNRKTRTEISYIYSDILITKLNLISFYFWLVNKITNFSYEWNITSIKFIKNSCFLIYFGDYQILYKKYVMSYCKIIILYNRVFLPNIKECKYSILLCASRWRDYWMLQKYYVLR